MMIFLYLAIALFFALGLILIVLKYRPIFKLKKQIKVTSAISTDERIEQNLEILQNSVDEIEKAGAFVSLMMLAYVLIHTIVNKGNKYNDEVQTRNFCATLTPELIKAVYNLEGKYE